VNKLLILDGVNLRENLVMKKIKKWEKKIKYKYKKIYNNNNYMMKKNKFLANFLIFFILIPKQTFHDCYFSLSFTAV
jgi:hypothetical protein